MVEGTVLPAVELAECLGLAYQFMVEQKVLRILIRLEEEGDACCYDRKNLLRSKFVIRLERHDLRHKTYKTKQTVPLYVQFCNRSIVSKNRAPMIRTFFQVLPHQ